MFTLAQIYQAYLDCRDNKRNTRAALAFDWNQEENITHLVEALNHRTYRPTTSTCFYIDKPKSREVFAADFSDRIVHHLLYTMLAPVWEKIFIDQSFACRPKKGIHKAARVLQGYLRKITASGKKHAFYLKMDVSSYFMSINKHVLYHFLCKQCQDEELKWLLKIVIFHDPTKDYQLRGSKRLQEKIPRQKSLFHVLEECGLPIGNLTSQFFANIYLNELDHFVRHVLKCRFYLRYVDDFILLATSIEQLLLWQQQIIQFLEHELLLKINPTATRIDSVFNGVDFVGYIVRPFYILCRRRVIGNCKTKLKKFRQLLVREDNGKIVWQYDSAILEQLLATVNSYLGHFSHANTRKIVLQLFKDFSFLNGYFKLELHRIVRKYKYHRKFDFLKQQVDYFSRIFPNDLVLFKVGCYYEAYRQSAERLGPIIHYKIRKKWRRFESACGFHQRQLPKVLARLEQDKISYVLIEQTGNYLRYTMERVPVLRVEIKK